MEPYVGEIRIFAYNRIPQGWAACDGAILQISQYQALAALIGSIYGGDGRTTFALPDLRGRAMLHQGRSQQSGSSVYYQIGQAQGTETITLSINQIPNHNHTFCAYNVPGNISLSATNVSNLLAQLSAPQPGSTTNFYAVNGYYVGSQPVPSALTTLYPDSLASAGGNASHENRMPYLTMIACIALVGIFPPRD